MSGTAPAVHERALLDFWRDCANQAIGSKRTIAHSTGTTGAYVRSDEVRQESALGFPPEHRPHDGVCAQTGEHDAAHFRIRREITRLAFDATGAGAERDDAQHGAPAG